MKPILASGLAMTIAFSGFGAQAQTPRPGIIRGEILSVAGATIEVRTRSGEKMDLHLKEGQTVTAVVPAQLSDVKPGAFIGAAAAPGDNGTLNALEVHIFPEAQRGSGEGFRPFDLQPGSSMTNANISARVDTASGPKLTLTYKGGEQTIIVGQATPIVTFAPGEAGDLKPGASVDIFGAVKTESGSYEAARILVGRNGLKVPM